MTTLEREIAEKVSKLDTEHQRQVLAYVEDLLTAEEKPRISLGEWLKLADEARTELLNKYGENFTVNVQSLLDEVRDEPTDERLGRR